MKKMENKKQPEKKFRAGLISATIWLNQTQSKKTGEMIAYRTITLQKAYKDNNGAWQNSNAFRVNDIPRCALVLKQAYEFLVSTVKEAN
jgi:hypothetical protein